MQTDTLLAALAVMRQGLMCVDNMYGTDGTQRRLTIISCMRDYIRDENAEGFTDYCQTHLATGYGDTMVDLLEELYAELGLPHDAMWDDFAEKFL